MLQKIRKFLAQLTIEKFAIGRVENFWVKNKIALTNNIKLHPGRGQEN